MLPEVRLPLVLGGGATASQHQHLSLTGILLLSTQNDTALYKVLGLVLISLQGIMKERDSLIFLSR